MRKTVIRRQHRVDSSILLKSLCPAENPHDLDIVPRLAASSGVAFTVQRVCDLLESLTIAPKLLNHRQQIGIRFIGSNSVCSRRSSSPLD